MAITFHKYSTKTLIDKDLHGTARTLYDFMLAQSNIRDGMFSMYVGELADGIKRTKTTTRIHLNTLIKLGYVTRILRQDKSNPKMNIKSIFIVHDVRMNAELTSTYEISEMSDEHSEMNNGCFNPFCETADFCDELKIGVPTYENIHTKEKENYIDKELTINRGATGEAFYTPQEISSNTSLKASDSINPLEDFDLENVPEVLRTTAIYLLRSTGRKNLTNHEIAILRELLDTHTPVRIQKEIEKHLWRFQERGKNLRQLTFNYIGAALKNQKSFRPLSSSKTTKAAWALMTTRTISVQDNANFPPAAAALPAQNKEGTQGEETFPEEVIKNAISIIEGYEPTQVEFPQSLLELFEKIHENCTLEEYLKIKFPDAEEKELEIRLSDKKDIETAFKIDYACATCCNPEHCALPYGAKKGKMRSCAALSKGSIGRRNLYATYGGCLMCKYCEGANLPDPEFDRQLMRSGLSQAQASKTFNAYKHDDKTPDIIIAKSRAILSAQNNFSMVLAGQPRTGKTHLATAIALESMRKHKQAYFRSVPELLDELRQAAQEHMDFYGLMQKMKTVSCLILDDLGKEKTTQAGLDYLFQIVDYRYRNNLQTIITTNAFTIEDLKNQWNLDKIEPIILRVIEDGDWVTIGSRNP